MKPEFSRPFRIDTIGADGRPVRVEADAAERAALARRFDLPAIDRLEAELTLARNGGLVFAKGRIGADVTQSCVATGEPVAAAIDEPFEIMFSPPPTPARGDEEIELSAGECDIIFYSGASVDVGEAVAETLSLSLDPWPRVPGADAVLKEAGVKGEDEAGPFGALAGLKDKLKG
jgi:uncharacterized metal-binding protein YceD (DUF177 family)